MKIYFSNKTYLNISNFSQDYHYGIKHISFSFQKNTNIFSDLMTFFTNKNNLQDIYLINEQNEVLFYSNEIKYLYSLNIDQQKDVCYYHVILSSKNEKER